MEFRDALYHMVAPRTARGQRVETALAPPYEHFVLPALSTRGRCMELRQRTFDAFHEALAAVHARMKVSRERRHGLEDACE